MFSIFDAGRNGFLSPELWARGFGILVVLIIDLFRIKAEQLAGRQQRRGPHSCTFSITRREILPLGELHSLHDCLERASSVVRREISPLGQLNPFHDCLERRCVNPGASRFPKPARCDFVISDGVLFSFSKH